MHDWDIFVDVVPWFVDADANVELSEPRDGLPLPAPVAAKFPVLADLLDRSRVTPLSVNGMPYQLLAWDGAEGQRLGWLCFSPGHEIPDSLHPDHYELLQAFGGIVERFNEPAETWLINHEDVLTSRLALEDGSLIDDYAWAFEEAGMEVPISTADYYALAKEANGNTTLCHRETGKVLLFAPDHAFDFVVPLAGCPKTHCIHSMALKRCEIGSIPSRGNGCALWKVKHPRLRRALVSVVPIVPSELPLC